MEDKCLGLTTINNLPPSMIEYILCLVPIQEAARTSILSREWKYHWTKIPKLVFIEDAFICYDADKLLRITTQAKRKLFYSINQVMSTYQGPINEFSLSTFEHGPCHSVDIDLIIDSLSRTNTIKKLALDVVGYSLPESFFFLHKLTELYIHGCRLDVQPTFGGLGSLTTVYMENVITTKKLLLLFLSSCPLLKTVVLRLDLGSLSNADDSTIFDLLNCLPMIENLSIRVSMIEYFDQGRVPNKPRFALVHLKYLCIRDSFCAYRYRIPFYVFLIRSSPNLEKLKMKIIYDLDFGASEKHSVIWDRYSDLRLEHLNEFVIEVLELRRFYLHFLMLILAKSPMLKKVKILVTHKLSKHEEFNVKRKFSRCPSASQVVEIIVESGVGFESRPFIRGL